MTWVNGEWYDTYADSPSVKEWCPECAPDGVPEPYTLRLCSHHQGPLTGTADKMASGDGSSFWASGAGEGVGSEGNTAWCAFLHRRNPA